MKKQYAWSWQDAGIEKPVDLYETKKQKQIDRYHSDPEYRERVKARMRDRMKAEYRARYGFDPEYTENKRASSREWSRKKAAAKAKGGSPDASN